MNQGIINVLKENYPTARPGFVEVLVEALETHSKKNNDYNGRKVLFPADVESLFYDIRRKFGRLYNLLSEETKPKVDEKLKDTAIDLGNYSFLLAEELKKEGGDNNA
jgi:hypothetical protein